MPERFEVVPAEADQRLDKLLRQRFPALSFGQTQKLIRGGRVRVNGHRAKAADRIAQGMVVTLPYQGTTHALQSKIPELRAWTVYEDGALMALDKPAGLATQGGGTVTRHLAGMLAGSDLRLVHRLDQETSGLLLLAKGALMARHMTRAFAEHKVVKTYLAVVVHAPLDSGTLDLPLKKVLIGGEARQIVTSLDDSAAQTAVTAYQPLSSNAASQGLLRLVPQTGRTHQLRVHCAEAFGGIVGDRKYGRGRDGATMLLLHAWHLHMAHPQTGEPLDLAAPLPEAWHLPLERLGLTLPAPSAPVWSPL